MLALEFIPGQRAAEYRIKTATIITPGGAGRDGGVHWHNFTNPLKRLPATEAGRGYGFSPLAAGEAAGSVRSQSSNRAVTGSRLSAHQTQF
jgi:hypothetical protein